MSMNKAYSVGKAISITLLPSFVMTFIYYLIGNRFQRIPSVLLFFIVAVCILFPLEIFYIIRNKDIYKSLFVKITWWKLILYAFVLFGFAGVISATVLPMESKLFAPISSRWNTWLPSYFNWESVEVWKSTYSHSMLVVTVIVYFCLNFLILPIIEELYFRGLITEKLSRYGWKSIVIVTILFSLYHFWLPFQNFFRLCIFIPAGIVVYKKRNLAISMIFHCVCNLLSCISFAIAVL